MARTEMTKSLRDYLGINALEVDIQSERNATIYVPDSMIGSVVGQGGASVRELEEEYNLRFQVKGLKSIPRKLDRIPEEQGGNWDIQTQHSMGGKHWEQHGGSNKSRRRKGRKRR